MSSVSKEKPAGQFAEVERTIELAEEIPFWEAEVIYGNQKMVFRLVCAEMVSRLTRNRPPFDQVTQLQKERLTAVKWAYRYFQRTKELIEKVQGGFKELENVYNQEDGVFETVQVAKLVLGDDMRLRVTDPVDFLILNQVAGPSGKVQEDVKLRGNLAYPLFPSENSPCYLLREDQLNTNRAYVFSLVVTDRQSMLEFLGDESHIRQLF